MSVCSGWTFKTGHIEKMTCSAISKSQEQFRPFVPFQLQYCEMLNARELDLQAFEVFMCKDKRVEYIWRECIWSWFWNTTNRCDPEVLISSHESKVLLYQSPWPWSIQLMTEKYSFPFMTQKYSFPLTTQKHSWPRSTHFRSWPRSTHFRSRPRSIHDPEVLISAHDPEVLISAHDPEAFMTQKYSFPLIAQKYSARGPEVLMAQKYSFAVHHYRIDFDMPESIQTWRKWRDI